MIFKNKSPSFRLSHIATLAIFISQILFFGCDENSLSLTGMATKKPWHKKFNWVAEEYFSDAKVVKLCRAIEAEDLLEMQRLIDDGADVNAIGTGNMTPLLWAFPDSKVERLKLLLENGANPNVYTESDFGVPNGFMLGDSVTHMACRSQFDYFDLIFSHGGDPNLPNHIRIYEKEPPIYTVIRAGGPDLRQRISRLLELGADINARNAYGDSPLMLAASFFGQYDLCIFLLENGADPSLYFAYGVKKLTHILLRAEKGHLLNAGPEQRQSYDRLVEAIEAKGESMDEAREDLKRWSTYTSANRREMLDAEAAARKERELKLKRSGEIDKPIPK